MEITPEKLFQILRKNFPNALERLDQLAPTVFIPPAFNTVEKKCSEESNDLATKATVATSFNTPAINKLEEKKQNVDSVSSEARKEKRKTKKKEKPSSKHIRANSLMQLFKVIKGARDLLPETNIPYYMFEVCIMSQGILGWRALKNNMETAAQERLKTQQPATPGIDPTSEVSSLCDFLKDLNFDEFNILCCKLDASPEDRVQAVIDHIDLIHHVSKYKFS